MEFSGSHKRDVFVDRVSQLRPGSGGWGCWSVPTVGIRMVILRCQHRLGLLVATLLPLGCPEGLRRSHFQGLTQGLAVALGGARLWCLAQGVLGKVGF